MSVNHVLGDRVEMLSQTDAVYVGLELGSEKFSIIITKLIISLKMHTTIHCAVT